MRTMSRGAAIGIAGAVVTIWAGAALEAGAAAAQGTAGGSAAGPVEGRGESGLPLPRFVSLKADRVNLRSGPGTEYPTAWVYRRAGLPLEVVSEFEGWRQVRDAEGASGWIIQSLLSGRRTALVLPWDAAKSDTAAPQIPIRVSDSESARAVVMVEAGVIANVHSCDSRWCNVTIDEYRGYVLQKQLWGVYENEVVK